jgi:hypothetical protein
MEEGSIANNRAPHTIDGMISICDRMPPVDIRGNLVRAIPLQELPAGGIRSRFQNGTARPRPISYT